MQHGRLNVVFDAFWGSCGKGKVCDWLAATHRVTDAISSNMPNAGHTVVRGDQTRVMKVLPSAAPFNAGVRSWLCGSSGFNHGRMYEEAGWLQGRDINVSDRAFTVDELDAEKERNSLSRVSSTMQGSAAALTRKIMRQSEHTIQDKKSLPRNAIVFPSLQWRRDLLQRVVSGMALFEVSQGWGLSIDHGTQYPYTTSRNCGAAQALADAACPPQLLGDVIAVIRPYPIRVGNTYDGYSGDWSTDNAEVTWEHVQKVSGYDGDFSTRELTTVTKRLRRVATFSFDLLRDACIHNGVTGIFLNFAQYIDGSCHRQRGRIDQAPAAVRIFADAVEQSTEVPIIGIGTGADTFDVLEA